MNAEALKRLRAQANLSQAELAARAGISASIISRLEGGDRNLNATTLRALAEALAAALDMELGSVLVSLTEPQA